MDREAIEKEVTRLQARCYTDEGKAGIVTDYIMRLLSEQVARLAVEVCDCDEPVTKNDSGYCEYCELPIARAALK
jgi:hypothetical protein